MTFGFLKEVVGTNTVSSLGHDLLWVNRDDGRGATFHFTLPAAPAETDPPVDAA
jgi:hypothetical protein